MGRVGRKPETGVAKNAPLNMRTSPDLRERIEKAAELNGRSLTQEVERRLITSFIFDDSRGGPHIGALANMICAVVQNIELDAGKKWFEDLDTFVLAKSAIDRIIQWRYPGLKSQQAQELFDDFKAKDAAANAASENVSIVMKRLGIAIVREGECPSDGSASLIWMASGEVETSHLSPEQLAEYQRALDASLAARAAANDAWEMLDVWRTLVFKQLDQVEERGRSYADAIFAELGPREKGNGAQV